MTKSRAPSKTHSEQFEEACPNKDAHTPFPRDYLGWHARAEKLAATHDQTRCPGCGLWSIWVPATEFCSRCNHPVGMHDDAWGDGDTSCGLSECDCAEVSR